jgi:DNA-binding NarL/FixJ family response regulator
VLHIEHPEQEAPSARKTWNIATAGLTSRLQGATRNVCAHERRFQFPERMRFTSLRFDALHKAGPDIVLADEECLCRQPLTELTLLHTCLPFARTLLIGDAHSPSTLLEGLRVGLWGVLSRPSAPSELEHALCAVTRDELWLSRSEQRGLLMLALSRAVGGATEPLADLPQLTQRENAVMQRVIQGYANKEIARALGITDHTVKVHLHHIYGKLHLRRVDLLLGYRGDHLTA